MRYHLAMTTTADKTMCTTDKGTGCVGNCPNPCIYQTDSSKQVVGRFAPTPSGRMHLGNVFSLLLAWLGAHSAQGRIVLRIEDLDPRCSDIHAADVLLTDLEWLGLTWDEGPIYQSEHLDRYAAAVERLQANGLTYPCFCTRAELHAATAPHASDGTYIYQGSCRNLSAEERAHKLEMRAAATRLRVPGSDDPASLVRFTDLVVGNCDENLAQECGDYLVRRSDGVFAYQLAVVVDDGEEGVTQVVRGRDLLGSVARQRYLQELLGFDHPDYAHVPLLVAPDGRRLSKRNRDLDMGALRERHVRPEKIIGTLAHLAHLVPAGEELTPEELIPCFSWETLAQLDENIVVDTSLFE